MASPSIRPPARGGRRWTPAAPPAVRSIPVIRQPRWCSSLEHLAGSQPHAWLPRELAPTPTPAHAWRQPADTLPPRWHRPAFRPDAARLSPPTGPRPTPLPDHHHLTLRQGTFRHAKS